MKITKTMTIDFIDGTYLVSVSIERENSIKGSDAYWNIDAVVSETGLRLTNRHYGILHSFVDANKRLRAEKSIKAEGDILLRDIELHLIREARKHYIKEYTTTLTTSPGYSEYLFGGPMPIPMCSIRSKQSGECISWHYHDVFKANSPLTVTFYRTAEGQPQVKADENELYDFDKLRDLVESKEFKEQKYSFFFYNEVRRLLNMPFEGDVKAMSGMFRSSIK